MLQECAYGSKGDAFKFNFNYCFPENMLLARMNMDYVFLVATHSISME